MKFGKFAATALLAVATVGIAAGTADASPSIPHSPAVAKQTTASGVDHGVAYHATLSDLSHKMTTVVDKGRFVVAANGTEVDLKNTDGTALAKVPLAFHINGGTVHLAQQISADGRQLVLTPKAPTAKEIGEMHSVGSMNRLMAEINKNIVGVVIGGVLGGLIGAVLGFFFLSWLTGPIGLLVGAIGGGYAMGGQPFMDAVTAVLSGKP
ncbi:hypothetical protein [Nocardia macrotermitis]|uniref:DUF8020 domain-containing protein n=1 Tax=Nocardia macrotermitis TaxID=2585198 RepID=A0A7K0CWL7_9NOCA|nr:hypothetical protein [Nocardia macrotermitis]MQY17818.1 hypothetical protein [Nocardia macrotermitis]